MKILAFGASSSKNSINKKLAAYAANIAKDIIDNGADLDLLDLNDFAMPIYSEDYEKENAIPEQAHNFYNKIGSADLIIISYAEHNGSYAAAYKNIFDWASRINPKLFQGKDIIALSTSPGKLGGSNVLQAAVNSAPYFDGKIIGQFSVGSFYDIFDVEENKIKDESVASELYNVIKEGLRE